MKYQSPAMRVRGVDYTKNHLSVIIRLFKLNYNQRKGYFTANTANKLLVYMKILSYVIVVRTIVSGNKCTLIYEDDV